MRSCTRRYFFALAAKSKTEMSTHPPRAPTPIEPPPPRLRHSLLHFRAREATEAAQRAFTARALRMRLVPLPGITTEETLHQKMRKAKIKDMKKRRRLGLEEEEE